MKRSKHNLSHYRLSTFSMGQLVPVGCFEVLPGDTVQQHTSALIRVAPMVAPVMHPMMVRIHHWFVPYRLLWEGWEPFITGGSDGEGDGYTTLPNYTTSGNVAVGSLLDHLGLPTGAPLTYVQFALNAYNLIWNEYYRDQDLQSKRALTTGQSGDNNTTAGPAPICWEKDYFTASRVDPQKGPDVTLPLGVSAPVTGLGLSTQGVGGAQNVYETDGSGTTNYAGAMSGTLYIQNDPANTGYPNIRADLSQATAVDVNDVRRAFAIQRYQEARSRFGSRYTEYLRYLGVRSSDARLQRPEYLGGGKQTISVSEVLQTTPATSPSVTDFGVGDMYGHGVSAMRSRAYRSFFEEHGVVLSLASIRPKTIYATGQHRMFNRSIKEDFWQKELEHIGQQEVLNKELYAAHTTPNGVLGYNDRYSEYRYQPSGIAGEFRNTLNHWHMARLFSSDPALNASFVQCDPSKRINAVTTTDNLWCMFNHRIIARRLVSSSAAPRIY